MSFETKHPEFLRPSRIGGTKYKKACIAAGLAVSGSPTWTRTRDLRINSPSLYRLSYQGIEEVRIIVTLPSPVNIKFGFLCVS